VRAEQSNRPDAPQQGVAVVSDGAPERTRESSLPETLWTENSHPYGQRIVTPEYPQQDRLWGARARSAQTTSNDSIQYPTRGGATRYSRYGSWRLDRSRAEQPARRILAGNGGCLRCFQRERESGRLSREQERAHFQETLSDKQVHTHTKRQERLHKAIGCGPQMTWYLCQFAKARWGKARFRLFDPKGARGGAGCARRVRAGSCCCARGGRVRNQIGGQYQIALSYCRPRCCGKLLLPRL
jgi:hypothetical protein